MDSRVTRRYATALYDIARKRELLPRITEDVELLDSTLRDNPRLLRALHNPQVGHARRKAIVHEFFESRIDALTLRFIDLLVDKGRLDVLTELRLAFQRLSDTAAGIVRARVESAVALTDLQHQQLVQQLTTVTGKKVVLSSSIDSSLRGGAVVWIGDRVIDGSVAGYLKTIEARLSQGRAS